VRSMGGVIGSLTDAHSRRSTCMLRATSFAGAQENLCSCKRLRHSVLMRARTAQWSGFSQNNLEKF
jgi:hypothetical protein